MVLHHSQDVFQIAERIQVIRFRCFCDAVDDRTGFRAVDTVDQLPCMFVQAEAAQRAFRCVIIKRDFTVTKEYFSCLFLIDAVVAPFQSFTLGQATGSLDFFCPRKESLHQRFEIDLPLLFPVIRFHQRVGCPDGIWRQSAWSPCKRPYLWLPDDLVSAMPSGHRQNTFSHGFSTLRKRWSHFPGPASGRRSIRHRQRCL